MLLDSPAWRRRMPLLGILCVSAALRFWGLGWGLPNSLHSYSYHPDEFLILGAAGSVLVTGLPKLYNYPSLYIYLVSFAIAIAAAFGLSQDLHDLYFSARVISAVMGVAAVWVVYWAAGRCWGFWQGIVAAMILCIAPLHVQHSHFATVDVPASVFVAASLGFALLVLNRGSWRDYLLCGAMTGLAAGAKYNAGVVVLSLITAHFLGSSDHKVRIRRLLAALGVAVLAFVISTPAVFLTTREFLHGFTYELRHAASGHGLVFVGVGNGFLYTFKSSLCYGLGPGFAVLFAVSVIYGLVRSDNKALTILAFAVPYYAMISASQVRFARYAILLLPAAALLISWLVCDLWIRFPRRTRWAWTGVCGVIVIGTLLYTLALDRLFVIEDPRDRAEQWISANIPKGSGIGLIEAPWFYSPPYSNNTGFGTLQQREREMRKAPYHLEPARHEQYRTRRWWVVSDYEVDDALRAARSSEPLNPAQQKEVQRIVSIQRFLDTNYSRRTFRSNLSIFGINFGPTRSLPHDMRYPAPTICIYEHKK